MKYLAMMMSVVAVWAAAGVQRETKEDVREELLVQALLLPRVDVYRLIRTEGRLTVSNVMTFIQTRQAREAGAPLIVRLYGYDGVSVSARETTPYVHKWLVVPGQTNEAGVAGATQMVPGGYSYCEQSFSVQISGVDVSSDGRLRCGLS